MGFEEEAVVHYTVFRMFQFKVRSFGSLGSRLGVLDVLGSRLGFSPVVGKVFGRKGLFGGRKTMRRSDNNLLSTEL